MSERNRSIHIIRRGWRERVPGTNDDGVLDLRLRVSETAPVKLEGFRRDFFS